MKDGFARDVNWLTPWIQTGADAVGLEDELRRELGPDHPMYGISVTAIARRIDTDDVLFELTGVPFPYAEVHLTWSGRREPAQWTGVEFFSGLKDWIDRVMVPNHQEHEN
jgi:hypothetical protein